MERMRTALERGNACAHFAFLSSSNACAANPTKYHQLRGSRLFWLQVRFLSLQVSFGSHIFKWNILVNMTIVLTFLSTTRYHFDVFMLDVKIVFDSFLKKWTWSKLRKTRHTHYCKQFFSYFLTFISSIIDQNENFESSTDGPQIFSKMRCDPIHW